MGRLSRKVVNEKADGFSRLCKYRHSGAPRNDIIASWLSDGDISPVLG